MKIITTTLLCFCILLSSSLYAATIVVDDDGGGDFTTVQAAINAGTTMSGDIIRITGGADNIHTEAAITIDKDLTIMGNGQSVTIVQATNSPPSRDEVFIIDAGFIVSFNDLTIQNGRAANTGGSNNQDGGGVHITCDSDSKITFDRVTIKDNEANNKLGGGVYITGSDGTVSFTDCIISNNRAAPAKNNAHGGGIYNGGAKTMTLTRCTVANNRAGGSGGGVYVDEANSMNDYINCTVYSNGAGESNSSEGGGLYLGDASTHKVINCTVSDNVLFPGSTDGGGIYYDAGTFTLTNSIVADNKDGGNTADDIYSNAAFTTTTSLVRVCAGTCPTFSYTSDPSLGAVSTCANGQSYLEPSGGSDAIDNGTAGASVPTTDICGNARDASVDLGSKEVTATCDASSAIITTVGTHSSSIIGTVGSFTYYCNAAGELLLAIDPSTSGAVISASAVQVKVEADPAEYYMQGTGFITNADGAAAMTRRWSVDAAVQPTNAETTVRFFFTIAEFDALEAELEAVDMAWTLDNNVDNMEFFKVTNDALGDFPAISAITSSDVILLSNGGLPTTSTWVSGSHGISDHYAAYKVNSFSGGGGGAGGGGSGASFLPVEMLFFTAKPTNEAVQLDWATASELDNEGFEIEKSLDGQRWQVLGFVKGYGTTTERQNYSFLDERVTAGINYYRLKQLDHDGNFEYSDVRSINVKADANSTYLHLYPNPVSNELTVESGAGMIYIYNQMGVVLKQVEATNSINTLDIQTLPAGQYKALFITTDGHVKSNSFVKLK